MCRSRRELSNEYFFAKCGFDTAENEPCEFCPLSLYRSPRYRTSRQQAIKAQFNAKYVKPLFEFYDIDGNGYISREEFFSVQKHFLETLCGETVDMTKLAKQFDEIDHDHNRKIDFDEFKAEVERITSASHMTLKELIDALKNVSRSLEVAETCVLVNLPIKQLANLKF